MSEHDPLGLESEELLGDVSIEPTVPEMWDSINEREIAKAVARQADALADLTKLLPLPVGVGEQFRRQVYDAWSQLLENCRMCADTDARHEAEHREMTEASDA